MRCNKAGCPEEGEPNAVCADPRCQPFNVDTLQHGPPTKIFICPIHLGEAFETLQRVGHVQLLCEYCQGPWCYIV